MSGWDSEEDTTEYKVVQNHEGQFSIWPSYREPPSGWKEVGKVGNKEECLDYIKEVWMAQRPESLSEARKRLGQDQNDSDE